MLKTAAGTGRPLAVGDGRVVGRQRGARRVPRRRRAVRRERGRARAPRARRRSRWPAARSCRMRASTGRRDRSPSRRGRRGGRSTTRSDGVERDPPVRAGSRPARPAARCQRAGRSRRPARRRRRRCARRPAGRSRSPAMPRLRPAPGGIPGSAARLTDAIVLSVVAGDRRGEHADEDQHGDEDREQQQRARVCGRCALRSLRARRWTVA